MTAPGSHRAAKAGARQRLTGGLRRSRRTEPDALVESAAAPAQRRAARHTGMPSGFASGFRRISSAGARVAAQVWGTARAIWRQLDPITSKVTPLVRAITPLGWTVLALCAAAWLLAWAFGWREAAVVAVFALVLVLLSSLLTLGRMRLDVRLELQPQRVRVGDGAAARVVVDNSGGRPVLPLVLDVPIGESRAQFHLPTLSPGESYEEFVVIPTNRRAVLPVGPVTTGRGDPFGLVSRRVTWTEVTELFVHPRTVPVDPVGSGLLRDLEGHTTNDISMTDLAFHTLREYAPGDDRRYIHWRSSAKLAGTPTRSPFLVRQFLDTRRSHIAVLVDCDEQVYAVPDDFEIAVAAGASIAVRAVRDEMDLSIAAGEHAVFDPDPPMALDIFSRALLGETSLMSGARRLTQHAPDISVVVMITGPGREPAGLRQAAAHFPPQVNVVAIRVDSAARVGLSNIGAISLLTMSRLADLPIVLRGVDS